MILNQASKYGLRAALYIARQEDSAPILARDIADALALPFPILTKVLQELTRNGLLRSFKGPGGGFCLARSAAEISLLDIVLAFQGPNFGTECVLGLPDCSSENACHLHEPWSQLRDQILAVLEGQNLQQVMQKGLR